jgi:predicted ATP-grasp superfamily ATP-dependent carboligase
MRVFVYEYLCGGATGDSLPSSLRTEGWAMLSAVLEDFARCPGVRTVTLIDPALASPLRSSNVDAHVLRPGAEEETFRALAADCDWTFVIAPEFADILARRCRWVRDAGGRLLGPSSSAVRLAADKLTLARHWQAHGIPTPPAVEVLSPPTSSDFPYPLVCKPRDGAGSQATFLVRGENELARAILQAECKGWSGRLILQPYLQGRAVSVAFLAGAGRLLSLPAVEQQLSDDGRFHYRGGRLPLSPDLDRRARGLAEKAVSVVEGMHGYVGVDLVLGPAADGSMDAVIEINPRLTTSYIGLRRLARFNLAETLLALVTRAPLPAENWRTGPIVFSADGRVTE